MAASMCIEQGFPMRILGCDTPIDDILLAVESIGPQVLAISVSLGSAGPATDRLIRSIREALPQEVEILVGGAGAKGPRRAIEGVRYAATMEDMMAFFQSSAA